MPKLDHVVARFNGADLTFKIARADLDLFEYVFQPAFELFKDISAGKWTGAGLKEILAFALLTSEQVATLRRTAERAARGSIDIKDLIATMDLRPNARAKILQSDVVEAAFVANPPGGYVPLVQAILLACLLGVDEADARFTDDANMDDPDGP